MTAVKASDVDRAVAGRRPGIDLLLFFGPDAGRVAERARHAAEHAVDDRTDPFQLVRIDGDDLAEHPGKLVEEATTFAMFGGRRAVWVRPTSRNIAASVQACLDVALVDTLVVVEAGELSKSSPLRVACERSPRALALPCYADEARDLGTVIAETLREHGLGIDRDARDLLLESLGGDRLTTRGELLKLSLYAHGQNSVTVEDVEAVVSDVAGFSLDSVTEAAFGGDRPALDSALQAAARDGSAGAVLPIALRHGLALLVSLDRVASGEGPDQALRSWRGLQVRARREAVLRQLRNWREPELRLAVSLLQDASLVVRRSSALVGPATAQALFRVAGLARSAGGRSQPAA